MSIGALERRFFSVLADKLELSQEDRARHGNPREWTALRATLTAKFRQKTRAEWCELLEGTDACFAPVLSLAEAPEHPHNVARGTFTKVDGVTQANVAPRFDRTPGGPPGRVPVPGSDTRTALSAWGFSAAELDQLAAEGCIR